MLFSLCSFHSQIHEQSGVVLFTDPPTKNGGRVWEMGLYEHVAEEFVACNYGGWTVPKVHFSFDCQTQIWMSNSWTSNWHLKVKLILATLNSHLNVKLTFECQTYNWTSNSQLNITLTFEHRTHIWTSNSHLNTFAHQPASHLVVRECFIRYDMHRQMCIKSQDLSVSEWCISIIHTQNHLWPAGLWWWKEKERCWVCKNCCFNWYLCWDHFAQLLTVK